MVDVVKLTVAAYDESASSYAASTFGYGRFPGLEQEVAEFESAAPHGLLLDSGCGAGRDSAELARLGRSVVAVDLSALVLCEVRTRIGAEARINLVRADLRHLAFSDRCFAGVWASGSLLHIPDHEIDHSIKEMRRVLAVGGVAAVSMRAEVEPGWRQSGEVAAERWFTRVEPPLLEQRMVAAGFSRVTTRMCGRGDWYIATGVA